MPDLKVAFWNVRNLLDPACGEDRAPKSPELRPRAWSYNGGAPTGASDHSPLTARFRVATEA